MALLVADGAAIEVGVCVTRVQLNGSGVIAESFCQGALALPGDAAIVISNGGVSIKSDGEVISGTRSF